jgi:hypothetical protein
VVSFVVATAFEEINKPIQQSAYNPFVYAYEVRHGQKIFFFTFLLGLLAGKASAQTCCSGGVPLSSNLGLPPGNQGTWQFSVSYDQNVLSTLKEGNNRLDDNSRERFTRSVLFEAGYVFTKRFSLDLFFSYVIQERTIRQFGNTDFVSTSGIGDLAMLFKYRVTNPKNNKHTLLIGGGPKIPAGRTDFTREDGILLNADLQPGSGAWDILLHGFYNRNFGFRPSMGFSSSIVYSIKGTNPDYFNGQSYRFGNELLAQLSVADKFNLGSELIDLSITFRFRNQAVDRFNNSVLPNTGGRFLFLTPGTSWFITPSVALNLSGDIPLYTYVEGTQLAPTYRINIGAFFTILKRKKLSTIKL